MNRILKETAIIAAVLIVAIIAATMGASILEGPRV